MELYYSSTFSITPFNNHCQCKLIHTCVGSESELIYECRNVIDGYRVNCTAFGCSSLSGSTTQTTLTFNSADGVTSCNYRCCIQSYNNAGINSSTCISLRKKYCGCIMSVHFNSQLLFSTLQLFQVDPILCGELFRAHGQSKYRGHPHRQTTNTSLDIGFPTEIAHLNFVHHYLWT